MAKNEKKEPKVKPRIPKDEEVEGHMNRYRIYQIALENNWKKLIDEARKKKSYKTELVHEVSNCLMRMLYCIGKIEFQALKETQQNE